MSRILTRRWILSSTIQKELTNYERVIVTINLYIFFGVIIVLGAAVVWLLPSYPEFLDTILKILLGFAGGFGAGYGLKSKTG